MRSLKYFTAGIFTAFLLFGSIIPLQAGAAGLVYTCQGASFKNNGSNSATDNGVITSTVNGVTETEHECDFIDFVNAINQIMTEVFVFSIPIAIIAFTWAGAKLLFAQGNAGKITEARKIFTKVVIGFLIILAAWLIVFTIAHSLTCTLCLQFLKQS